MPRRRRRRQPCCLMRRVFDAAAAAAEMSYFSPCTLCLFQRDSAMPSYDAFSFHYIHDDDRDEITGSLPPRARPIALLTPPRCQRTALMPNIIFSFLFRVYFSLMPLSFTPDMPPPPRSCRASLFVVLVSPPPLLCCHATPLFRFRHYYIGWSSATTQQHNRDRDRRRD